MSRNRRRHPGFAAVAARIARHQAVPIRRARAELAAATRRASKAAKVRNPYLDRVKGRR
jgi:hypothetical protein